MTICGPALTLLLKTMPAMHHLLNCCASNSIREGQPKKVGVSKHSRVTRFERFAQLGNTFPITNILTCRFQGIRRIKKQWNRVESSKYRRVGQRLERIAAPATVLNSVIIIPTINYGTYRITLRNPWRIQSTLYRNNRSWTPRNMKSETK